MLYFRKLNKPTHIFIIMSTISIGWALRNLSPGCKCIEILVEQNHHVHIELSIMDS